MKAKKPSKLCPLCGWGTLPIVYGLPSPGDFEREDIILGGCIIEPMNPDVTCRNCDWSGQEWHLGAPLPPTVWIIRDPEGKQLPIGLVAGRYDNWIERFIFGTWASITSNSEYKAWLHEVRSPDVWSAPFTDLSPAVVAHLRIGVEHFSSADLDSAGFSKLDGGPPRFEIRDPFENVSPAF